MVPDASEDPDGRGRAQQKRGRKGGAASSPSAPGPAGNEDQAEKFKCWLADALLQTQAELQASLNSSINQILNNSFARMQAETATLLQRFDGGIQSQFNAAHATIASLNRRIDSLFESSKENLATVARLDEALAAVETSTPPRPIVDGFDRPTDPTICKIRLPSEAGSDRVLETLQSVLNEMALRCDQVSLEGQPLAKTFTLRFLGGRHLAAARAEKFLQLQRTADGWRDLHVLGPQAERIKLYIDRDKNGKQNKLEITTKRLLSAFQQVHPSIKCFAKRREGIITSDYTPLARVKIADPDKYALEWNTALVASKGVDTRAVAAALAALDKEKPEVLWG